MTGLTVITLFQQQQKQNLGIFVCIFCFLYIAYRVSINIMMTAIVGACSVSARSTIFDECKISDYKQSANVLAQKHKFKWLLHANVSMGACEARLGIKVHTSLRRT